MSENKTQETQAPKQEPRFRILGGIIGFNNEADLDKFIQNLDAKSAVYSLIAAVNYAQAKGVYSLTEASLIAAAVKKFIKNSSEETETADPETTEDEPNT